MTKRPPGKRPGLTEKQAMFVREYLVDLNLSAAAIRCGYSPHSAARLGVQMRDTPAVAAAIQAAMDERAAKAGISAEMVLENLRRMASYDVRDVVEWTGGALKLKDSAAIGDEAAYCITEIKQTEHGIAIKFADKQQANVNLGRHLKLFTDTVEHKGVNELAERMAEIQRKRGK
jgi:phage terminase small subunit